MAGGQIISIRDASDLRMIRREYQRIAFDPSKDEEREVLRRYARLIRAQPIPTFDATPESKSPGARCVSIPFEDRAPTLCKDCGARAVILEDGTGYCSVHALERRAPRGYRQGAA